ncbi:hypothetical protein KIMH_11910 [Bombiscardovia apis]|uniref:RCC1-like domain-containing protein n=1 Tax=Bombiscardovia apis TaxID=2932182 RepID=A0ABN6SGD9_9BIFI|nr:hypothetical protein KIMH_11910 [Bombiscardovia apis]
MKFSKVSAGWWHSIATDTDGNLWTWGHNTYGQLGNGTQTDSLTPQKLSTSVRFSSVSAGGQLSVALDQNGNAYAWGNNRNQALGTGSLSAYVTTPQLVTGGLQFSQISPSKERYPFITALTKTGNKAYAWGNNDYGQLGDGTVTTRTAPFPVNSSQSFSSISAGMWHVMAIDTTNHAWAWGANSSFSTSTPSAGLVGDGTAIDRRTPVRIAPPAGASSDFATTSVSSGMTMSACTGSDGFAYAWGNNSQGQLGDGTTAWRLTPTRIANPVIAVTSVSFDGIGAGTVTHDTATDLWHVNAPRHMVPGKVKVRITWTLNGQAQTTVLLDYEYTVSYSVSFDMAGAPVTPPGQQHVLNGHKASWPADDPKWNGYWFGGWELNGSAYDFTQPVNGNITLKARWNSYAFTISPTKGVSLGGTHVTVTPPAFDATLTQVSAGWYHSLGLGRDGKVYAWGRNDAGQLGDGSASNRTSPVAVHTPGGMTFTQVVAGPNDSFALATNGSLYAWGWNSKGQLGNGNTVNQSTPVLVPVPDGSTKYTKIIPGRQHTLAVTDTGALYAWGGNDMGQLGEGTTFDSLTPVKVKLPTGVTGFTQISAGSSHTVALGSDGRAYSWGWNGYGQLGSAAVAVGGQSSTPVAVDLPGGVSSFKQVVASNDWSLGISSSGHIYTWGYNGDNQLGDGTTTNRSTPVAPALPGGLSFDQVSVEGDGTVALASSGAAYAWGWNGYGQLGTGNQNSQANPAQITPPGGVTYAKVMVGRQHSLAIDTTGKVWTWGDNQYGQLGNGTGGSAGNLSLSAVGVTNPKLVISKVRFDSTDGTGLTPNSDGTWGVITPAHADGPVTVTISWSLVGTPQTDYPINSYTYFTVFNLPNAGSIPLNRLTGGSLLGLSALTGLAYAGYTLSRKRRHPGRNRRRRHPGRNRRRRAHAPQAS